MNPQDHPVGRFDHIPTAALVARNARPHEWAGFHRTLFEIRNYPERDEWDRKPMRPDLST